MTAAEASQALIELYAAYKRCHRDNDNYSRAVSLAILALTRFFTDFAELE